jgi:uncharacterized surface protein with fasciclin (FAS1) repeats
MKFQTTLTAALLLGMTATAFADGQAAESDIVDTAVAAGSFKTLTAALQAAGLVDALKGEGPLTVFAPTDEAFAKLPAGTVENLLKPENRDSLIAILTYHVAAGSLDARAAVGAGVASTLNGQRLKIEYDRTTHAVSVGTATVVKADITCSNGVIHVLDTVQLPSMDSLLTTATKAGSFSTLAAAIEAAGLIDALSGEGPFTVFAPTDEAFAKLPAGTLESLLLPENKDQLVEILTYHVVPGRVYSDQALAAKQATTLQGTDVKIAVKDGQAMVNGARLITTDLDTTNGVIHVIDTVILPGASSENSSRSCPADEVIRYAMQRSERLQQHGQTEAAAEVFAMTAYTLVELGGENMPASARRLLEAATTAAAKINCSASRSKALRQALQQVSREIQLAEEGAQPSECPHLQKTSSPSYY